MKNSQLKIFSGRAHPVLAQDIARYLGESLGDITLTTFPDGESFVKINDNIRGKDVFIIQPTGHPANENIMELLIMIDAARRASADRITAVIPFFGYARQDRKDQPRVPITAKLVANLLVASGVDRVLTMDLHAQQIQGFFDIPVDHLYASSVMVDYLRKMRLENLVVVAPDVGGVKTASTYAQKLQASLAIVTKKRKSPLEVVSSHVIGEVAGKNVFIIDDMTETAGTLVAAATILKQHGVSDIYAGVSHAVLTDLGVERLKNSPIKQLIATNSVPPRTDVGKGLTILSIAELLGEGIRRIHRGESVSSLFLPNT